MLESSHKLIIKLQFMTVEAKRDVTACWACISYMLKNVDELLIAKEIKSSICASFSLQKLPKSSIDLL